MKPTVIYLLEETDLALQDLASQKGKTPSEIIQEMLDEHLCIQEKRASQMHRYGKKRYVQSVRAS